MIKNIGDKCTNCNKGILQFISEHYPYNISHLKCNNCDSTFTLKYKPLWSEDKNSLNSDMISLVEKEFKVRGINFSDEKSDELCDLLDCFLEQFSTGDYRRQLG